MFDTMEPETKHYLKKVMNSLFIGLFWMFANVIAGIFLELGFIGKTVSTANIIYYSCLLISLFFLLRWYWRVWKNG